MRFSAVAVTLLGAAASASASSLVARQSYPTCAATCTSKADLGGCIASDIHCLCTNQQFVASTTKCIYDNCTGADLTTALSLSQQLCAKVGVTLTSSYAASATGASAASTPTASKSGASTTSRNAILGLAIAALTALSL